MSKLILTAGAKRDLADIEAYITNRLKNGGAALRLVASVTKALRGLEQFPNMGRVVESDLNEYGYRALVCGDYLAFYRVDGDTVYVDRILYGRRDYMALLFGDETGERDNEENK